MTTFPEDVAADANRLRIRVEVMTSIMNGRTADLIFEDEFKS